MYKLVLPISVFIIALFIVDTFFGIDVKALFKGFADFVIGILMGGKR